MNSLVLILTLALVTSTISHIWGFAMEGHVAHLGRCKCLKYTSATFRPKQLISIQVIPQGIHCWRTETILTLKNGRKYCVYPNPQWVNELLKKLTKSYGLA